MKKSLMQLLLVTTLPLALTSCGGFSISNPFGSGKSDGASPYQGATRYLCADKKQFYVRMLANNQQAWLIYPDHEVGLNQSTSDKNKYISGAITLVVNGNETTLNDGEKIAFHGCQPQK